MKIKGSWHIPTPVGKTFLNLFIFVNFNDNAIVHHSTYMCQKPDAGVEDPAEQRTI